MLDYSILDKKPYITVFKDGDYVTYKDLSTKIYLGNLNEVGRFVIVEKYYVARPDLISLAVYGDDRYGDIICKINGISNPFELNEGMRLYVPDMAVINKVFSGDRFDNDILDEFKSNNVSMNNENYNSNYVGKGKGKINNSKLSQQETIDKKKAKNLQKYKNERRSPGEQTVADKNYIIDKTYGIVIY